MKGLLNLWYPRNLALYDCITILKTLVIFKFVYINTSVLTFPQKFVAMVSQAITQFVWNKKSKIKYRMFNDRAERARGPRHADFETINDALKVVWVRRLSD